jgi:isoleucyl-tRNA synthetase
VLTSADEKPMSERSEPGVFAKVAAELDFPAEEARVAAFWKTQRIFEKSLKADTRATGPSRGTFVFYEGPPTANGLPHNGHVLTRAIKDMLPRYKAMRGYDVPRKAGWDTHGLPVEVEVEKDLGIHGKAEIEAYGVKPFIKRCIDSVFRYTEAWKHNTEKIGYWLDLDDAYVTYHKSYVESVWWALGVLHQKGLLYRGHRVCWWWPQGGTALSAAEVGWNYKTVDDPSVYVALPLSDDPDLALCVWTTTPWTLPSNGYAAVRGDLDYVEVEWVDRRRLIMAEALRAPLAAKLGIELVPLSRFKGKELVGKRYLPCFDTFSRELWERRAELSAGGSDALFWRVIEEDFVTLDAGTGIVHVAPAFGEDDNEAHKRQLKRYRDPGAVPLLCAVEPDGHMSAAAGELAGLWVKDADPRIVADLDRRGLLVHHETYRHDYPFCWRADDDPLIQLARPAWYIRTTERIDQAIANNQSVYWLPDHIKDGRFGDFLRNNVDWALSRERFWGTPLNVWVCDGCEREEAPQSVAAIEAKNARAFDHFRRARAEDPSLSEHLIVHKPWIDEVVFPCTACGATMRRVPEVIDAWFDSGSMPFAQFGFPHVEGSHARFSSAWPADFISEAIDQTRGWFYSLLMISTLVFDEATEKELGLEPRTFPHPYRACVVLGHVCDREGKKESKSKGNYTPPDIILERVRMEFAVMPRSDAELARLDSKLMPGAAYIAREDYEGLDLSGNEAEVRVYPSTAPEGGRTLALRPVAGLPRRVVVLADEMMAALGVERAEGGLGVKPSDVPRLAARERVMIEDPTRPAPGADAFRWFFYAASPPWTNTRHSLTNVRLAQKDFLIKLRNVFQFFVIYANIDGFDPARGNAGAADTAPDALAASQGYRPVAERSELDRWISSEVALALREVMDKLDFYDIYAAAQRIVELVDGLSNWYVRRSRPRFWASAADPALAQDKYDASFTLYETLVTIAKMIAPFVPFFAESMYQNLVRRPWPSSQPESVHLCAYPAPDTAAIDESLAIEMRAVRELSSLGLQVRTAAKLKVRQPLERADVVVSSRDLRAALERHAGLISDELNVHGVRWLSPGEEGQEVSYQLKPNFRLLGPRLGKQVQLLKKALAEADAAALRGELAQRGRCSVVLDGDTLELSSEEVEVAVVASEGYAAAGGKVGVVVLTTALSPELLDEGLGREVLSRVQSKRKELALDFTARIVVKILGSARVCRVVEAMRQELIREALCAELSVAASDDEPAEAGFESLDVQGERLWMHVRAAAS